MSVGKVHYEWQKNNCTFVGMNLNNNTDADIIAALDGKSKQTEIKRLVRIGIEAEKKNKKV